MASLSRISRENFQPPGMVKSIVIYQYYTKKLDLTHISIIFLTTYYFPDKYVFVALSVQIAE